MQAGYLCVGITAAFRHVDLHNMAWESVTKAMDATIQNEKAGPLFDKAADSFRDVACMGLNNWGMVHQMQGARMLDGAMRAGEMHGRERSMQAPFCAAR